MTAQLFTHEVFEKDLSNWQICKFAALNQEGVVWLFEAKPTLFGTDFMTYGYCQRLDGKFKAAGSTDPVVIQKDYGSVPFECAEDLQAPVAPLPQEGWVPAPAIRKCNIFDCVADAMVDDMCCKGHATPHSTLRPSVAPPWECPPSPADAFPVYRHKNGCAEKCAASVCPCNDEPKEVVYPINHPGPIHQYTEEVFVWYDEAGLQGGVAYSLEQANADKARYFEYLDKPSDSLELNNIRSRITKMFNVNELTTTQVLAILGDHWQ